MPARRATFGRGLLSITLLVVLAAHALPIFISPAAATDDTVTLTLFDPETFTRSNGTTYDRTFNVPSTQGSFKLHVVNGDGAGHHNVSSATIKVNGTTVVLSSDLNQQVNSLDKALTDLVHGSNSLHISIGSDSTPSSYITVSIEGIYVLEVLITNPPEGTQVPSDRITVLGSYASYTSNVTIDLNGIGASLGSGSFTGLDVPISEGSNTVTATITTADGISDSHTIYLNLNRPPVAEAGADRNAAVGETVTLDGRSSSDPEGALITYRWSFGSAPAGSGVAFDNATSVMPSFVPDFAGAYVASLVVNDGLSESLPDTVMVTAALPNVAPTAEAGPDISVSTGNPVRLDGTRSFDPEGSPLSYSWSFLSLPAGSGAVLSGDNSALPSFTADVDGSYTVRLTVSDGQLTSLPDTVNVAAAHPNAIPVANAGSDNTVSRNTLIRLDGTHSYDPDNDPLNFFWSIVSKPQGSASALDNTASPTPSMRADAEGEYVYRLIVNDGLIDSLPDTVVISSVNDPPTAVASASATDVIIGTSITLNGSGSTDANGDPLTYAWSIVSAPAGGTAAIGNPTAPDTIFTPDVVGPYAIQLVVYDGKAYSTPAPVTITARAPTVPVPNVVGMAQAYAQAAIVAAQLAVGTVTTANNDTVPTGCVISQNPVGGSQAPQGSSVTLVVSSGPAMVSVPLLAGLTESAARAALAAAGLATGIVTTANNATVPAGRVVSQDPSAGASVLPGTAVSFIVSLGPAMVAVPDLFGKPQGSAQALIVGAGFAVGTTTSASSETVIPGNVAGQNPAAGAMVPQGSTVNLTISSGPAPVTLPPDPVTVAPPVDPTVATNVLAASAFLHAGANPIQTGVAPGTIELKRAAVVRGKVTAVDNTPLSGVKVGVLGHPEFGQTVSRGDGKFDLAVNGGGYLTLDYKKGGFLPAQRQVNVPWNDYAQAPDVVLLGFDSQVTSVDLSSFVPVQLARGSVVTDSDGTRQSTLFFAQGTQATMRLPDNTTRPLSTLSVRATEYTVGPNGSKAMPAALPPQSAYTYCVELSVDEAVAAGATEVTFDRAVVTYVENFLGFPVGTAIPVGYYDRKKGMWVPSDNGRIIKVLSITAGLADLDIDGDGAADNTAALSALGITDAERAQLASLYAPGAGLWRVRVNHFTAWDSNWGWGAPGTATVFNEAVPKTAPVLCPINITGSVIECQNQVLGESVSVAGTPFSLQYKSDRVPGRGHVKEIPLTGSSIPQGLTRVDLEIHVAGQFLAQSYPALPNQHTVYAWDAKDGYGRSVQGEQSITIRIGYVYSGVYQRVDRFGYNGNGIPITGSYTRKEVTLWKEFKDTIGTWDARGYGLGGWFLDAHHAYDPAGRMLYMGDGTRRSAEALPRVINTVAGGGSGGDGGQADKAWLAGAVYGVAAGPDGSYYLPDGNNKVRRVRPDGIITTVAGTGNWSFSGDGGPATQACLNSPRSVGVGSDGSLYIADTGNYRIRKVGPDGIITTIAGNGLDRYSGDGGPAVQAAIGAPYDVVVGADGSVYLVDPGYEVVRKVGVDGIITTVAGGGSGGCSADGTIAKYARLCMPEGVALGPDGTLYIAEMNGHRILKVGADGILRVVAGSGQFGFNGDGIPATQASLAGPTHVAVGRDGSVYISESNQYTRVRRVSTGGIITTMAGIGQNGFSGDSGPALKARVDYPMGLSLMPEGTLLVADTWMGRIRKVAPSLPGLSGSDITISSEDGGEIYYFDASGKHQRTVNSMTGAVLYRFEYDANGSLSRVYDMDNNVTTIERDARGNPAAIVAPGGQRTSLVVNSDGYMTYIANPGGEAVDLTYVTGGLLHSLTDPNRSMYYFEYTDAGLLTLDQDPEGGFKALSRMNVGDTYTTTVATSLGRRTAYRVERQAGGDVQRTNTLPTGATELFRMGADGSVSGTDSYGTISSVTRGPDPRFGMNAPVSASSSVRTPDGLVLAASVSRTAAISNPDDPLSLTSFAETTTIDGQSYVTGYTPASRRWTSTTPVGRVVAATTDPAGRVLSVNVASSVDNVNFGYDSKGRLAQAGQGAHSWTFGYDDHNRLTAVTDPQTHSVQYGYDNADRVSRVILPSGRTYGFAHDNNGNVTEITMPSGAVHGLGYNRVNLDNAYVPPGNLPYGTQYSLDREWKRTILPSGKAIDGAYDNGGRLHDVTYPEGAVALSYFDNTDRVATLSRSAAPFPDNTTQTLAFSYDGFLTTRVAYSGVANGEYRYSYNNDFNVTGIALDNAWTTLSRDNDGLLTGYGPFTISRSGPAGAPSALTDNTLSISYTYDSFGRPWVRTHTVAGQQVYQLALAYDNVGRINTKTEIVSGTAHTYDYEYDLDGQLFQVRKDGILVEQYGYDNNANCTSTLTTTATYDDQDRLIEQAGVSYTFDADGYLTSRGADSFTYSARGELLSATVGGQTTTYRYDGMARRIGKTDGAGTVQYLYGNPGNPFQVTASRDVAGILTTYFFDVGGNLYAFERNGARYYVATDHLGTPKAVTDGTGAVVKAIEYDSWGVKTSDTNPSFDLPVGFAGGIRDDATGLVRFGYRDYEPGTGRWLAKDPVLFGGGQPNLFQYAANDPVNRLDRSGLQPFLPAPIGPGNYGGGPMTTVFGTAGWFAGASVGAYAGASAGLELGMTYGGLIGLPAGPLGSFAGAIVGGIAGSAIGGLAGGIAGGFVGRWIGHKFEPPWAGSPNWGEDEMLNEWYRRHRDPCWRGK